MRFKIKKTAGFSLVELLAIVSIVGILVLISIPYLKNYQLNLIYEQYASSAEFLVRQAKMLAMTKNTNVGVCVDNEKTILIVDMSPERRNYYCIGTVVRTFSIEEKDASLVRVYGSGAAFDPRGFAIYSGNVCLKNLNKNTYFLICISRFGGIRTEKGVGDCRTCQES